MKRKITMVTTLVVMVSLLLASVACGGGGIPQADFDKIKADLNQANTALNKCQENTAKLQAEKEAWGKEKINLDQQIADLKK